MKTILVCVLLCMAVSIHAQTRITGKVIDARDGELLPRVTVKVSEKRTAEHDAEHSAGAFTDSLGKFSLEAPHKGMFDLSVKMVGYAEKVISIDIRDDEFTLGDIELQLEEMNEEVVVHSERYFTVIEDACCNVEAINREFADLAPFSPSPTQLLRRYSSCTSSQISCSIDNSSSVRLRGLDGSRILLYLDGMPLFGALTSMYALQQIPSTAIANMKIYEGVSSVQYGNGAISGVVDFETKPPAEPNEFNFITNIGSPMESIGIAQRDVSASYVGAVGEDVGVAGFISYNGHELERDASPFSNSPSYDRLSGFLKTRFPLSNSARLTIAVLGAKENRFGGEPDSLIPHYTEDISSSRIDAYTKLDLNVSESANLFASFMYSNASQESAYGARAYDGKQDVLYGSVYMKDVLDAHQLKYGVEVRNEKLGETTSFGTSYNYTTLGAYAEDEWVFADGWVLLAGLRFDNHTYAGSLISPRAAISYWLTDDLKMRFSTGQGFKGQALLDEDHMILHGEYAYRNNTSIGYEKSWTYNYDISYNYALGDVSGTINAIAYYTPVSGRATPQADSLANGTLYYVNSSNDSRIMGLEIQTRPVFSEHWSGALGLGIVRNEDKNANGVYESITLVPKFSVDMSLMYQDIESGWNAESWASVIGAQKLPTGLYSVNESPSYALVNLRLSKQFGSVQLFAGMLNILDERQDEVTPTAIRQPNGIIRSTDVWGSLEGREVFFGVKLTL